MDYTGRNTVWGFRERVLKNLEYLNSEREMGADVHVVTELITSLLGLIVFPYEEIKERGYSSFERYKLNDLPDSEWPSWKIEIGSSDNLADLVRCATQYPTDGFISPQTVAGRKTWMSDFGIARIPRDQPTGGRS